MMVMGSWSFGTRALGRVRTCVAKHLGSLTRFGTMELVVESLRTRAHPGVTVRSGPTGHRAALSDGPDVWEVIAALHMVRCEGQTLDEDVVVPELAAVTGLSTSQVSVSLRYYRAHSRSVDRRIAANTLLAARAERGWLFDQAHPSQRP